jgi:hypothetical protein
MWWVGMIFRCLHSRLEWLALVLADCANSIALVVTWREERAAGRQSTPPPRSGAAPRGAAAGRTGPCARSAVGVALFILPPCHLSWGERDFDGGGKSGEEALHLHRGSLADTQDCRVEIQLHRNMCFFVIHISEMAEGPWQMWKCSWIFQYATALPPMI